MPWAGRLRIMANAGVLPTMMVFTKPIIVGISHSAVFLSNNNSYWSDEICAWRTVIWGTFSCSIKTQVWALGAERDLLYWVSLLNRNAQIQAALSGWPNLSSVAPLNDWLPFAHTIVLHVCLLPMSAAIGILHSHLSPCRSIRRCLNESGEMETIMALLS